MRIIGFRHAYGIWFFKVLGYGLHFKNTRVHHLYFSERNGYGPKFITVCGWRISVLTP